MGTDMEGNNVYWQRMMRVPMPMLEIKYVATNSIDRETEEFQGVLHEQYFRVVYVLYSYDDVKRWIRHVNREIKRTDFPANLRSRMFSKHETLSSHWYYGKFHYWRFENRRKWLPVPDMFYWVDPRYHRSFVDHVESEYHYDVPLDR